MLSLNTHQLNVFLAAAETLNFTQAAHRLQVTQPSVSQHVQALEEHFDVPLFIRSGRNIELTEAGVALIPLAREMVSLTMHIEETMSSLKGDVHGHLIVGCSTPSGRYVLPRLLARFHNQYPQVRATCYVSNPKQACDMLSEGKIHLAFAADPPILPDVEFRKFAEEKFVLVAPLDHPWAMCGEIDLQELVEADFILPDENSEIHSVLRTALSQHGMSIYQLKTLIYLGSLEAIALSVQENLGVGFVPELIVNRLVQKRVAPIRVRGLTICREVYAGRNLRRPATAALNAFWDFLFNPVKETAEVEQVSPSI